MAKETGIFGQLRGVFAVIPITTFEKIYGSRSSIVIHVRRREGVPVEHVQDKYAPSCARATT